MEKENAVDIRKALEVAKAYADAGIDFVPVPVMYQENKPVLIRMAIKAMNSIKEIASKDGQ